MLGQKKNRLWWLFGLLPAAFVVWCMLPSETVDGVRKRLEREVPIGTARSDVETWLDRRGIEHSPYQNDSDHESTLAQNGIRPGSYKGYIIAIIRDTDGAFLVTGSIQFYTLFDENDRVARHIVRWVGTGP